VGQQHAVVSATVTAAGLESTGADRATVLVFLDQRHTSDTARDPVTNQALLRAGLVRQRGRWRLDQITPLPGPAAGHGATSWPGPRTSAMTRAAQSCVRAMNSVDYRKLDGTVTAVRACTTGSLHDQWISGEHELTTAIRGARSVSRVTAAETAVRDASATRATVLVAVTSDITTGAGSRTATSRVLVTVRQVHGNWLVATMSIVP
jgi:hypothetical protein